MKQTLTLCIILLFLGTTMSGCLGDGFSNNNDDISMFVENNQLIITKGHNNCDICGNKNVSVQIKDKFLCSKCLKTIKNL